MLRRIARRLKREHGDPTDLLPAVMHAAVTSVLGSETDSISYVHERRRVTLRTATGDLPAISTRRRTRLQEGLCLDAVWGHRFVLVEDMRHELRGARFAAGVTTLGGYNRYAQSPCALGEEAIDVGLASGSHAAIALTGWTKHDLRRAIDSRDLIGHAPDV